MVKTHLCACARAHTQTHTSQLVTLCLGTADSYQLPSPSHVKLPLPNFRFHNPCKYSGERKRVDKSRDFYTEWEFGLKDKPT